MKITPYLVFNGNCREAITYYEEVLDAKVSFLQTFAKTPEAAFPLPDDLKNLIFHAILDVSGESIMLSDNPPGIEPRVTGDNVTLALSISSMDRIKKIFSAFAKAGKCIVELQKTFWSECAGIVRDKFGVTWSLEYNSRK